MAVSVFGLAYYLYTEKYMHTVVTLGLAATFTSQCLFPIRFLSHPPIYNDILIYNSTQGCFNILVYIRGRHGDKMR